MSPWRRYTARYAGDLTAMASGWDAVTVLTVGMLLTCAIPSSLSVAALGPLGRPGVIWFLGAVLWWEWSQLQRPFPSAPPPKPARRWLFIFLGVILVSYALTNFMGSSALEARAADSALIKALSWIGIFLIANDGITDRRRLLVLLRRAAVIGALMSTLGLLQFVTGQSIVSAIDIPGFTSGSEFGNVQSRAGFLRAAGTASHPLEYGVVLCMSLPLAITLALQEFRGRSARRWFSVGAILVASALSVSRSALIGIAAGLVMLFPSWSKAVRIRATLTAVAGVGAMYLLVPGMVGTVRGLFTGLSEDASTASRTDSYDAALEVAARTPVMGRGLGTFLPEYRILDNQYLLLLIEVGAAGLISFIVLIAAGIYCCERARRRFEDALMKQLSVAVMASLTAGALTFAFFDAFSFPMSAAYMFLLLGTAGALWRIAQVEGSAARISLGGMRGQSGGVLLQSGPTGGPGKEGAAEVCQPGRFPDEPPEDSPHVL